jgi:hypothetical protein
MFMYLGENAAEQSHAKRPHSWGYPLWHLSLLSSRFNPAQMACCACNLSALIAASVR